MAPLSRPELGDRSWLSERYVDQGMTAAEIAAELGCHPTVVTRALKRHGIVVARGFKQLSDAEWLRGQYMEDGRSTTAIAQEIGCNPDAVRQALGRHGIQTRPAGSPTPEKLQDRAWLAREYKAKSALTIASSIGCSEKAVLKALHRHGIEVRPQGIDGWI